MKKQLFFDDNRLFVKDNVVRKYGRPQLESLYYDGVCSTDYCTGYVFRLDSGKYRMLYFGHSKAFSGKKLFAATSDDGVHFSPEQLYDTSEHPDKTFSHEIMNLADGWEVAYIYEDEYYESKNERYKLIMSEHKSCDLSVADTLFVSADLLHWTLKEGVSWGNGTEPLASVFYNKHKRVHTIIERPFWGIRCVGYKETADWQSFSEYNYCLNVDSDDETLSEIYGMLAFEYDGMYIGLPHIYRGFTGELCAKFKSGVIDTQLAYSYDGRYWRRSLREPFLSGVEGKDEKLCADHNLLWVSNVQKNDDGNVYFYASASELEHGPAFRNPGTGKILIYKMRRDGFISLSTEDKLKSSTVATREKIWHGGEIHYNLKAAKATVAVYITDESELVGGNVLGLARPIDGYGHEDCIEFSGDSTDWLPKYKSGKKIDDLSGKSLVFELKFENGELFSLSGDYTDAFNTEGARFRKFGALPE